MNLAYAYDLSASIKDWTRTFTFEREKGLEINDRFSLSEIKDETFISFIAYAKPNIKIPGEILFNVDGKEYLFEYKSSNFSINIEEIDTSNDEFLMLWNSALYRIVLKPISQVKSGNWSCKFSKV